MLWNHLHVSELAENIFDMLPVTDKGALRETYFVNVLQVV
jgi:hypothetical protein